MSNSYHVPSDHEHFHGVLKFLSTSYYDTPYIPRTTNFSLLGVHLTRFPLTRTLSSSLTLQTVVPKGILPEHPKSSWYHILLSSFIHIIIIIIVGLCFHNREGIWRQITQLLGRDKARLETIYGNGQGAGIDQPSYHIIPNQTTTHIAGWQRSRLAGRRGRRDDAGYAYGSHTLLSFSFLFLLRGTLRAGLYDSPGVRQGRKEGNRQQGSWQWEVSLQHDCGDTVPTPLPLPPCTVLGGRSVGGGADAVSVSDRSLGARLLFARGRTQRRREGDRSEALALA
jgi:hypothetical protein